MRSVLVAAWLVACSSQSQTQTQTQAQAQAQTPAEPPARSAAPVAVVADAAPAPPPPAAEPVAAAPAPAADAALAGHDFTPVARALFVVAACGEGAPPDGFPAAYLAKHCAQVTAVQDEYKERWVTKARPFFAAKVPAGVPKTVVYPFAGGDLSTALTVYPDADEITTMSLEPSGDPRTLAALLDSGKDKTRALEDALSTIRAELRFLYRVNFSNTMNMIDAMRAGKLPTQLSFGLSALKVHGYEIVSLRYFKLDPEGKVVYLTDEDVAAAPAIGSGKAEQRNRVFANAELRFRKPGGRVQIYRHIQVNLDDTHTKQDPRILRHLEAKGQISAMTKAASYLLSWSGFSNIRNYLLDHAVWMVSDATGVPPKYGKPKGFEYETYGMFQQPHIGDGQGDWRAEWAAQPRRTLAFRFGYHDGSKAHTNHLVIMRKPSL